MAERRQWEGGIGKERQPRREVVATAEGLAGRLRRCRGRRRRGRGRQGRGVRAGVAAGAREKMSQEGVCLLRDEVGGKKVKGV